MKTKNLVYFDLETQRSAQEVGGWHNADKMGVSIAVTYSTQKQGYTIYAEDQVNDLLNELRRADLVIGYNIVKFDYSVLSHYSLFDFSQIPTLDMLLSIEEKLGRKISLDAVVEASIGINKTADGSEALKWWRQGKVREIAEYCCYDVKATRWLHEFGATNKKVFYVNSRTYLKEPIPVNWTC